MIVLTEEDPADECVCIVPILGILHIAEADHVQLKLASATSSINGEQYRPGNQTADEANSHRYLEVAQKEIAVQGVVVEDIAIWDLAESAEPIEHAFWQIWRPLSEEGDR